MSGRACPGTGRPHDAREQGIRSKIVAEPTAKPGSVVDNHSSRPCVTAGLKQHTRGRVEPTHGPPIWPCSEWGLPCPATLSPRAVGSYPTVSPSPRASCDAVRLSALCCTFRRLAAPRRYLALCSVEPGLSSPRLPAPRLSWPTPPRSLSQTFRASGAGCWPCGQRALGAAGGGASPPSAAGRSPPARQRNSRRSTLPTADLGRLSRNSMSFGCL